MAISPASTKATGRVNSPTSSNRLPINSIQPATHSKVQAAGSLAEDTGKDRILVIPCCRNSRAVTIRRTASALAIRRLSGRKGALPTIYLPPWLATGCEDVFGAVLRQGRPHRRRSAQRD